MPLLNCNGMQLYYKQYGNSHQPTLILISGLGRDHSYWLEIINKLKSFYNIVVFDNRGTGKSPLPKEPYDITTMADDVARLMESLEIEKANILGHSMGGFIAQIFADKYPNKVNNLILYSTGYHPDNRSMHHIQTCYELMTQTDISPKYIANLSAPWAYSIEFFKEKSKLEKQIQEDLNYPFPTSLDTIAYQIKACSEFNSLSFIDNIKSNTLILCGKEDFLLPVEQNQIMASKICNSQLQIINNTSHLLHIEDPSKFAKIIFNYLETRHKTTNNNIEKSIQTV